LSLPSWTSTVLRMNCSSGAGEQSPSTWAEIDMRRGEDGLGRGTTTTQDGIHEDLKVHQLAV
jgi:hypothetical protein